MNLAQMYALANSKSGYARADGEIYAALGRGGFRVYAEALKAQRGFFLKFDEVSLTLQPNFTEYALPADLTQIVHLSERRNSTGRWLPMAPLDLNTALDDAQNSVGWYDLFADGYGDGSEYGFYGPYLDATATVGTQIQKIRIAPMVDATRFCQIAYTAKWMPITDASSMVMLPDEGTYAMENFASAELCAMSDDSRAGAYMSQGQIDLQSFLFWLRSRQIQSPLTIDTYGPGN